MKKIFIVFIFILICSCDLVFAKSDVVKLSKCVDGDTAKFIINGKEYSTRFLAIDTPEVKHPKKKVEPYGKEASKFTCDSLTNAKEIVLEYDDNSTEEDKYGRKLAWIFVDNELFEHYGTSSDDDELLQEKLITKGYAKVAYLYDDYKYTNRLKIKEKEAKKKKNGIWSDQEYIDDSNLLDTILDKIFSYIRKEIKSML